MTGVSIEDHLTLSPPAETSNWGHRLRLLLRRHGMSQADLATHMEVSSMTVTKWIRGGGVSDAHLDRLCSLLQATRSWLRWGEDFFDDSIWMESPNGKGVIRAYVNGTQRLSLATVTEATHGFVTWMLDSETNTWQWSGNAHRFFGLRAVNSDKALHMQLEDAMSGDDRRTSIRLLADIAIGARMHGWMRFTLKHKPNRSYFSVLRNVPSVTGRWRVYGVTVSNGGLLSQYLGRWEGARSNYEEDPPKQLKGGSGG